MSVEAFLAVLATAGIVCLIVGVERVVRRDRTALDKRLRRYGGRAYQLTDEEQKQAASQHVTQLLAKRVEASLSGRTFAAALQTDLARANLRLTVGEFVILQVGAMLAAGTLAWLLSGAIFVGSIFAAVGWFIPKIWLGRRQSGRLKSSNNQLGDTIQLMSNSLRSGLSLVQSMEMISRESEPPISDEFQRVVREIGLGVGPQEALLHLVRRVASDDLDLLVVAILVQFEIGGNLSRILDSIANTIRERVKLKGEIRTMSAQGRMAGYVLSGMPVAIGGLQLADALSLFQQARSKNPTDTQIKGLEAIQRKLALAGNPYRWTPADYLGAKAFAALVLGGVLFFLMTIGGSPGYAFVFGGIGVAFGWFGPELLLRSRTRARQKQIQRGLPDALDLLVISVEAGLGFDAAIQRLVEKREDALATEFARVRAEMRVGRSRRDALKGR